MAISVSEKAEASLKPVDSNDDTVPDASTHLTALNEEEQDIEKRLRRKLDLLIMPLVVLIYLMNYIDRNNYAAARLQGLEEDLNLTPAQYQTGLSILFVGYVLAQIPANILLNYFGRPSLFIGFFNVAWGLVTILTPLSTGFSSICAARFFLGIAEAPLFPGVLFYLSKWYTKKEINLRMNIFYSGSFIAGAFGNLIAAGVLGGLDGARGLASWKWLYIIEGAITIALGIVVCLVLPDFPHEWKVLTPAMRAVAVKRLAIDAAESDVDEKGTQSRSIKLAFTDSKVYVLAGIYTCIMGTAGFQNFFPTLTATLGYSRIVSLLLVAPPYVFITFYSYFHGWLSDRLQRRFWFLVYPVPLTIIGLVVFMTTESFAAKYVSLFLMMFALCMAGTIYSWIASSLARPTAKRAAAYAFINAIGNATGIWTPFTYRAQDQPHYRLALGICCGLQFTAAILGVVFRSMLKRENEKLRRIEAEGAATEGQSLQRLEETAAEMGTDVEGAHKIVGSFRYVI